MHRQRLREWLRQLPLRQRLIAALRGRSVEAYLVGGTVRDALLGRDSCDLDLAVAIGTPAAPTARELARSLADQLHGAYVPLDDERDVGRIVVRIRHKPHHVDVAALRGQDIECDLWGRDFTINAMAVPLGSGSSAESDFGDLLDPTGGQADLRQGLLRVVRDGALLDDPLRILRAVRLCGSTGFSLSAGMEGLVHAALPSLARVSYERIRDELMLILSLDDGAGSLAQAGELGIYDIILPELAGPPEGGWPIATSERMAWLGGVRMVRALEGAFSYWAVQTDCAPLRGDSAVEAHLGHHIGHLAHYWAEELSSGRERWLATKLAALLWWLPGGSAGAADLAMRLRVSNQEARFVGWSVAAGQRLRSWPVGQPAEPLTVYRYFRTMGEAGVAGAILYCCEQLLHEHSAEPCQVEPPKWLDRARTVLDAWYLTPGQNVDPPALISGRDVMHALRLQPSAQVGRLLEVVREAQVLGAVRTRQEALALLRQAAAPDPASTGADIGGSATEQ